MAAEIDIALLRRLLRYEPETGRLFWLPRTPELFPSGRATATFCANWNAKYANTPALDCDDGRGYRQGNLFGRHYRAHRVVFALEHGHWPLGVTDHENGDRSNNRAHNLRDVPQLLNGRNTRLSARNRTGIMGVTWDTERSKWFASIGVQGRTLALGRFDRMEDAVAARRAAERLHQFHENHGRAA